MAPNRGVYTDHCKHFTNKTENTKSTEHTIDQLLFKLAFNYHSLASNTLSSS